MKNIPKVKTYPLDHLYFAHHNGKDAVALLINDLENVYVNISSGHIMDKNAEIVSSFLTVLKENNLDILLTDVDGNQQQRLSVARINDLLKILERKWTLNQVVEHRNQIISNNVSNIVSDLLGLNISTPSTPFRFSEKLGTTEIVVQAKKLELFKKFLLEYIKASFLTSHSIILSNGKDGQDYRVSRSLKKAKIIRTEQMKNNTFSVNVNKDGKLKINDVDINDYQRKQDLGFQKTFRF